MRTIVATLTALFGVLVPIVAQADEEDPEAGDFADGPTEVMALEKRNQTELAGWSSVQPSTPYAYPQRKLVVDAPWGSFLGSFGSGMGVLVLSTILPHIGVTLEGTPQPTLAWSWSFPLGPKLAATREKRSFDVYAHRPFRLVFEPILVFGERFTFAARPGIRFMHHPSRWPVGVGIGLGSNVYLASKEGVRVGLSPEAVVRLGPCCKPGFVTLTARPEIFPSAREAFHFSALVGFTYF